jgi:hypothetical protein
MIILLCATYFINVGPRHHVFPQVPPSLHEDFQPNMLNISYRKNVTQIKIITYINFLGTQLRWPTLIL